jgi:hypothetical protein
MRRSNKFCNREAIPTVFNLVQWQPAKSGRLKKKINSMDELIFGSRTGDLGNVQSNSPLSVLRERGWARFFRKLPLILLLYGGVLFACGCSEAFLPPPENPPYGQSGPGDEAPPPPPPPDL